MFKSGFIAFMKDEEGASAIEYALIAALIAVALVTSITSVRTALVGVFNSISSALTGAGTATTGGSGG